MKIIQTDANLKIVGIVDDGKPEPVVPQDPRDPVQWSESERMAELAKLNGTEPAKETTDG